MAENDAENTQGIPPLNDLVNQLTQNLFEVKNLVRLEKVGANALQTALANIIGVVLSLAGNAGAFLAEAIAKGEDEAAPAFNRIAGVAIKDMFGVDVGDLNASRGRGGNSAAANAIGDALLRAFSGQAQGAEGAGEIVPSDAPAKTFLSAMAQLSLEGWLEGWIVEALSLGQIETFGDLDDTISHVLGLGRASAAVHGPLVRTMIVTPLEWKILKDHRPTLLPTSTLLKRYFDGQWTREQVDEELGRQGYSPARIDALVAEALPRLTTDEALTLAKESNLGKQFVVGELRAQGYDEITTDLKLQANTLKRIAAIRDNALSALTRAFVNNDITESTFRSFLPTIVPDDDERTAYEQVAQVQREVSVQHLSHGEAIECVELGILTTAYYRAWLEREGYPPDEATALELRLRMRIDKHSDVEKARRELADERAAAAKQKAAAAAARQAAIEQERALARRGPLSELTRAAVRGLVPIARVEEVLRAQYDADTVQIFVDDLEQQRQDYLAQQQKAEDAKNRATVRHVDVGDLEQAVLSDVLSIDQYRARLGQLGFDTADADLLTATLRARKSDKDAAEKQRRDAAAKAKTKSIDLNTFEQLVRRGARTFAQYDALLTSLGFDVAARAAMAELLKLQIADDEKARKARAAAASANPAKGLTLEQFRRAVILKHATIDDFDRYLTTEHYTPQAHQLLVAELRDDLAAADAARRARSTADASPEPRALPLSTVRRAAQLGLIAPGDYADRLVAAGYAEDDIAIEMDLLLTEIADVQAARAKQAATDAAPTSTRLSLTQMAAAVRAGVKHLEDYRALAVTKGLDQDSVNTLVRVLGDELASSDAARARRAELGSELLPKDINLAVLEQGVRDGTLTLANYAKTLVAAGLNTVDVGLLVALLNDEQLAAGK